MQVILLSGGSGKRLWPLSNGVRSKQFLKVLKDENECPESMVQRVFRQLKDVNLGENIVIATNINQVDSIYNQLGSLSDIVVEPERRNTFPAIILAAAYLAYEKKVSYDEVICAFPVDSYAGKGYFEKLKELESIAGTSLCDIALLGVNSTYPSEKYGYILPEVNQEKIGETIFRKVKLFKEKPDLQEAKKLLRQNALWNCGVFAFQLGYVIDILQKEILASNYSDVLTNYSVLNNISFDYEVIEKAQNIVVVEYNSMWEDLGTWNTLTKHMETKASGNAVLTDTSTNTHVINELNIPILISGIKNAIIAVSADGILISDKYDSSHIKEYVENIEQKRPMYEKRRWGSYKVLDYSVHKNGQKVITKQIYIKEGKNLSYQFHRFRKEIWTIIVGNGELLLDGRLMNVSCGDVIQIPVLSKHSIRALSDMEIIEIQLGDELEENDIERIYIDWDKIVGTKSEV